MPDPYEKDPEDGVKVLVVEDEYFIGAELCRILKDAGCQVLGPAASIGGAFDLLQRERPDIAVLDVHLGSVKVTPVAEELQRLGIPFVLATASTAYELAAFPALAEAINVGKPTDPHNLVISLRALVTQ